MIDITKIREDADAVKKNLARRGVEPDKIDELVQLDASWLEKIPAADELRQQQKEINEQMKKADTDAKQEIISQGKEVAQKLKQLENEIQEMETKRQELWNSLPNFIAEDVPDGGEENGEVLRSVPEKVAAPQFEQKSYLDLLEPEMVDIERATKVSGSRFVYLKSQLARLEIALVSFIMDHLEKDGFVPVIPPVLVGHEAMAGMGYLGKHADEIYKTQDDLYLVGTSEQSVGAMHMSEILDAESLPLRYVAYSSCFRREAGSHGKDVKGMLRVHQFNKVEMFSFTTPEKSADEHDFLLGKQEEIMQALELPYRVVKLAAQDTGSPSQKTYDIETWIPSEQKYRETHSTSNTTDYQARRLNIRLQTENGKEKAHMLNGTASAIGRTLIALIENHQQADGSIKIPAALHSYLPFTEIKKAPSKRD